MNLFVFCVIRPGEIEYGLLQAGSGADAREELVRRFPGPCEISFKGITSKSFDSEIIKPVMWGIK